jgi:phosphate transport system permease protein
MALLDQATHRTTTAASAPPVDPDRPDVPRSKPAFQPEDLFALVASMLSGLGLTWLLFERILPLSGTLGFWVFWYVTFLAIYAGMIAQQGDRMAIADKVMAVVFTSAGLVMVGVLALIIGYTVIRGIRAFSVNFFTQDMALVGPLSPLHEGGVLHAIVGSLEQVGIAILITVPLGITTALYLNEVGGGLARFVRLLVDAMSGLPSIIAGLFIFTTVILGLGQERSGFAASLALSVMMLPIITRTSEVVFRLVPGGLREASYALGASQFRTAWNVTLPTARTGLVTAVILGVARGIGETAPVLLTAGFTSAMNANPFHGAQVSLPLYIFNYVGYPQHDMVTRAYGAALVLLLIVCTLFVIARMIGGRAPGDLSRRQRRKLAAQARASS